ncbi:hypothetical protein [Streptomyces pratensis]|uniref:hypothetical protein n=1 Tax=Streptomyces pratensis TaxID=1169025 RepID=UPI001933750D|nr:hypothetical protein [Streptomyces pratensis]
MTDSRLFGHWYSGPFDVGGTETSELNFLPDGRGWSRLDSMTSVLSIGRFRWSCPGPGLLEILYELRVDGTCDTENPGFATVDSTDLDDEVIRTGYHIGSETPPYEDGPITSLVFEGHAVEFAFHFARGRLDISPADDHSAAVVPYDGRGPIH